MIRTRPTCRFLHYMSRYENYTDKQHTVCDYSPQAPSTSSSITLYKDDKAHQSIPAIYYMATGHRGVICDKFLNLCSSLLVSNSSIMSSVTHIVPREGESYCNTPTCISVLPMEFAIYQGYTDTESITAIVNPISATYICKCVLLIVYPDALTPCPLVWTVLVWPD